MKITPISLTAGLMTFVLHTLASTACFVNIDQSTGDLVYDDGAGKTLPYRLFLPEGYDEARVTPQ